jgi:hypothetical protein
VVAKILEALTEHTISETANDSNSNVIFTVK